MNIGKSKPYAILVFGAPMSGKTSFAEHFSQTVNAPFLNLTQLIKEYGITQKLAEEIIRQIAKSHSTIIIEGLIDTEEQRKNMRELLQKAGYEPVLVWVQTDLNTIKQRMRHSYRKLDEAKAALTKALGDIEAPSDSEQNIVISGKHTYQTQCRNVINRIADN
jgi:gluconate kinase